MLVLLDIDGVILPANGWSRPEILPDEFPAFSERASKALQRIIDETSADILLTSTHKSRFDAPQWRSIFSRRGVELTSIAALPENAAHMKRGDEILAWFSKRADENAFVIIDDDKTLNALPPHLKSRLVLTSSTIGLTNELAGEAIRLLLSERITALV